MRESIFIQGQEESWKKKNGGGKQMQKRKQTQMSMDEARGVREADLNVQSIWLHWYNAPRALVYVWIPYVYEALYNMFSGSPNHDTSGTFRTLLSLSSCIASFIFIFLSPL